MNPYVRVAASAALKQPAELAQSLRDLGSDADIFATLRRHSLIGIVLAILPAPDLRATLPSALVDQLEAWRRRPQPSPEALLAGFAAARDALEAEGIPVLLLKGCYLAEHLYGGLAYRPQFDVDVLVRERDFRHALRTLTTTGFVRKSYDLHATTVTRDQWELDVHRCLRRAPAFRIDEQAVWGSAIDARVNGVPFRTLSDERTLVLLILGTFEDLGQGMAKLRQLLDIYLLARTMDAHADWDRFFASRETENLTGVCVNVLSLVSELFEGRRHMPRLEEALEALADRLESTTQPEAVRLVFAPRKRPENLAWFARVYPGSFTRYLAWFWYGGFPDNLKEIGAGRLVTGLRAAFETHSRNNG